LADAVRFASILKPDGLAEAREFERKRMQVTVVIPSQQLIDGESGWMLIVGPGIEVVRLDDNGPPSTPRIIGGRDVEVRVPRDVPCCP
jgi:hypothetical protein